MYFLRAQPQKEIHLFLARAPARPLTLIRVWPRRRRRWTSIFIGIACPRAPGDSKKLSQFFKAWTVFSSVGAAAGFLRIPRGAGIWVGDFWGSMPAVPRGFFAKKRCLRHFQAAGRETEKTEKRATCRERPVKTHF